MKSVPLRLSSTGTASIPAAASPALSSSAAPGSSGPPSQTHLPYVTPSRAGAPYISRVINSGQTFPPLTPYPERAHPGFPDCRFVFGLQRLVWTAGRDGRRFGKLPPFALYFWNFPFLLSFPSFCQTYRSSDTERDCRRGVKGSCTYQFFLDSRGQESAKGSARVDGRRGCHSTPNPFRAGCGRRSRHFCRVEDGREH